MKEALTKVSMATWDGTKKASAWGLQKSKEQVGAYKKRAKIKAVENRREERRKAAQAEAEHKRRAEERKRQKAAAIEFRIQRHSDFLELLSDDFNLLETDVSRFLMSRPHHEQKAMIEKYAGEKSKTKHTHTPQRGELGIAIALIKPFAAAAVNAAGNAMGPVARYNFIVDTIRNGGFTTSRPISELHEKELGVLRLFSFFNMHEMVPDKEFEIIKRCIAYNSGSSIIQQTKETSASENSEKHMMALATLQDWLKIAVLSPQQIVQEAIGAIGKLRQQAQAEDPELVEIIDKELKGGAGWMNASKL